MFQLFILPGVNGCNYFDCFKLENLPGGLREMGLSLLFSEISK